MKKCDKPKLAEKLPGFMDGTLSREEMEEFDEHLLECDECKEMFFFALDLDEDIKKYGDEIFPKKDEDHYDSYIPMAATEPETQEISDRARPEKVMETEEKIRAERKISEIKSFLRNTSTLTALSKELALDRSILKDALKRASEMFVLFAQGKESKKATIHNIEITLHKIQKGEKHDVNILGNLADKLETRRQLPDESILITSITSTLKEAIKKGANAAFHYIQEVQKELFGDYDKSLRVSNYIIDCNFEGYSTVDGPSIGLPAAIATVSCLLDVPTKKVFALTGTVDRQTGNIGIFGGAEAKIKKAMEYKIKDIVIPEANYKDEKEELEALCKPGTIIHHKDLLNEVVELVFDVDKLKQSIKDRGLPDYEDPKKKV